MAAFFSLMRHPESREGVPDEHGIFPSSEGGGETMNQRKAPHPSVLNPFHFAMKVTSPLRFVLACASVFLACVALGQESKFDEPPMPTKTVAPVYPNELKREGVAGMVTMSITVDESGSVQNAIVKKSTRPEFEQPAIDAVSKWKFEPAKKDGKPVSVQVVIPVKFSVK